MSTPLYSTDIIPLTSRPTLTVMDDGDYFVILDTSTGKISKILRTNIQKALNISYDNATSGLTAETVQAALDKLVVNLGSSDSAISALYGRLDTLEGTGYTEGSLKTHEDRLDTLEGTGEGSVEKAIDDALEPIDARLDITQLAVARHDQSINALEKKVQGGQGATVDYTGVSPITTDGRSTGRMNVTANGLTATNIVSGASVAIGGTVTFASVLNHKYFDVLHGVEIIGTGSDITVTNDSGKIADMAIIYTTAIYGSSVPTVANLIKIFRYILGTQSLTIPARLKSVSADTLQTSTIVIQDTAELRSVPAIADQVLVQDGEWCFNKRINNTPLNSSLQTWVFDAIVESNLVARFYFLNNGVHDWINQSAETFVINKIFRSVVDSLRLIGENKAFISKSNNLNVHITLATLGTDYANFSALSNSQKIQLFTAFIDAQGLEVDYQLATPTLTKLHTLGALTATPSCAISWEGWTEDSYQTDASSQITLPHAGAVQKVFGYDEHFQEYEVPSTGYTQVGTLLTIIGAEENEVWYVQQVKDTVLYPQMTVNTLNNLVVPKTIATATYTVVDGDHTLLVSRTTAGTCAITIPSALIAKYIKLVIKDSGGLANTNNITISTEGTEKIDDADTYVINTAKGRVELSSDGSNLWVVG